MKANEPVSQLIPQPAELRQRLASALREVEILRRLIRLAEQFADPSVEKSQQARGPWSAEITRSSQGA